jgi:phosphoglycolate phosphatase-like HAD superfamily hydrolase
VFLAVVFDFDGTLVDSNAIKREGFFRVASAHAGSSTDMEAVLASVSGDRRAVFEAYARRVRTRPGEPLPQVVDDLVHAYSSMIDSAVASAPEMAGATRLLEDLRRRRIQLYLSSATPLENLQEIVAKRGWTDRFDRIYGRPTSKVDALRHVMTASGFRERDIAVVGDGEDDLSSANSVGCAYFPVGEARGSGRNSKRIYTLPELTSALRDATEFQ